jgi:diguanylate cyclase (GGDEF)-like protein/PAS domain S-box-containing protein
MRGDVMTPNNKAQKSTSISDLFIMTLVVMVVVLIGLTINFHEKFMNFVADYESLPLDDLIAGGVVSLLIGLIWYSWRRVQEATETAKLIQDSENRFRSLVESTDTSIYLVDRNYNYLFMNKKHLSRIGVNKNQYIGQPFSAFHSPEETELFIKKAEKVFKTCESIQFEYKSFRVDKYFLQTFSPIMEDKNEPVAMTVISKEITDRKYMEKELKALSLKDDLTGLYNRRGFTTLAEQHIKMAKREKIGFYVLYADLDNLKMINDTFGHKEGSRAISDIANIFQETYREVDIIARLGGDEFAIIHVGLTGDNIDIIDSRLQAKIDSFNLRNKRVFKLSLSVGISYYDPEHPCSIDELIVKADTLMYEHKKNKKHSAENSHSSLPQ